MVKFTFEATNIFFVLVCRTSLTDNIFYYKQFPLISANNLNFGEKVISKRERTVRKLTFIILFFCFFGSPAQESVQLQFPEQDSAQMELERQILYRQLLSGTLETGGLMEPVQLPEFNFNNELMKRYNFDLSGMPINQFSTNGGLPGMCNFSLSPFFRNGAIFSQASYKLNDKFTMGGYSFGANSVFSAPFPNQGMNNFDTRGATMFMQYKVSKNIKIETRVSVSQGPGF